MFFYFDENLKRGLSPFLFLRPFLLCFVGKFADSQGQKSKKGTMIDSRIT